MRQAYQNDRREALRELGLGPMATAGEIRAAFREKAKNLHPDKPNGNHDAFLKLKENFAIALQRPSRNNNHNTNNANDNFSRSYPERRRGDISMPSSSTRNTEPDPQFVCPPATTNVDDPRKWDPNDQAPMRLDGKRKTWPSGSQIVWRCKMCPEESSVCCKLKAKRHQCLCTHKLADHGPNGCTKCACNKFEFHVQMYGWEVRHTNLQFKIDNNIKFVILFFFQICNFVFRRGVGVNISILCIIQ